MKAIAAIMIALISFGVGILTGGVLRRPEPFDTITYSGPAFVCLFDQHESIGPELARVLNGAKFSKDRTSDFQLVVIGDGKIANWIQLYRITDFTPDGKCHIR